MKKFFVVAASLLMAAFAANAQESENNANSESVKSDGALTVEVAFNPFASNAAALENNRLNAIYSFSDNMAVRLGLGFGVNSSKDKDDNKTTTTAFSFVPGFVYSFDGTNKFTPYVGAEVGIGTGKTKTKVGSTTDESGKIFEFGVNAFTGMNYYFSKNLYCGVECGIGFGFRKNKDTEVKNMTLAPYAVPAVRFGWAF